MAITEKAIAANRKKWVAALRSGKYKQGISVLYNHRNNRFCCLGVAACAFGIKPEDMWSGYLVAHRDPRFANVAVRIGLTSATESTLVRLNDACGWNFNQIADWIEENLK